MTVSERILKDIKLSEKRMRHTLGVEAAAQELATRHFPEIDRDMLSAAALMHDFTKEYSTERQLELCSRYGVPPTKSELLIPKLLHGKTAAILAEREYNLSPEAVDAIRWHTTGKADMTPMDIAIYFADYIEEYRSDESCIRVREYYHEQLAIHDKTTALYKGLLFSIDTTIQFLLQDVKRIDDNTVEARNWLIDKLAV